MVTRHSRRRHLAGGTMINVLILLMLLSLASASFIDSSTAAVRISKRQMLELETMHLCEAGIQAELLNFWRPFKVSQNFTDLDTRCASANASSPTASVTSSLSNVGSYAAGVIGYYQPTGDTYSRVVTIRCVGWIDSNHNGVLDANEPSKIVDVQAKYELTRSQVFDYTYFINNYGWMDGFGPTDLVVNGDMRANGNFSITNGSPTINGSVIGCSNDKLIPAAQGLISGIPLKWDNTTYAGNQSSQARWRQAYSSSFEGTKDSSTYAQWSPFIFDSDGNVNSNQLNGAIMADVNGSRSWTRTSTSSNGTSTMLDQEPTSEVIMPDLSDLSHYTALSQAYVDPKATYGDGTTNPNYGQGAYLKVWNSSTNTYQTITTSGVLTGSAGIIGTSSHPILIHGPVTFTQDCVIKGYVSGQGTIYTGRNVHIVGSVMYQNGPDFRGTNMQTIDNANEKKDMLGLAARGSVIIGDVSNFNSSYPLPYMTPPFTHARYDDNGNLIPAFDATQKDSTGFPKYQSVMGNSYIHSIAEGVNQIDAILYTNFVGGGDLGTSGGGVKMNGTIISKDEAMVLFSLPFYMNYDNRIKERTLNDKPLIDLQLPRSPVLLTATWQDRGFNYHM